MSEKRNLKPQRKFPLNVIFVSYKG